MHGTGYQQESSPRRSVSPTNTIMVPPSLLMGQAPRYDEVYYPRTDKRMISNIYSSNIFIRREPVRVPGQRLPKADLPGEFG